MAKLTAKFTTFVARGPYCWGKSATSIEAAVKEAKKHAPRGLLPRGRHEIETFRVDGEFQGVDGMGRILYKGELTFGEPAYLVVR